MRFSYTSFPESIRLLCVSLTRIHNCIQNFSTLPKCLVFLTLYTLSSLHQNFLLFCDQALDLLVSVSSTHCCAYTPDLSTLSSSRSLTVFLHGISYLEVGFTLRCFQRLSTPHFATRHCRWRDNRYTIGAFIPVLSY